MTHPNSTRTCITCGGPVAGRLARQCRACFSPIRPLIDNGDGTHTVPLTRGAVALIDSVDASLVKGRNWHLHNAGGGIFYAATYDQRKRVYLHRLIMGAGPGECVDHWNLDKLDCRRENLRDATRADNNRNVPKRSANHLYKCVYLRCDGKKWVSHIQVNGKRIHLGSFDTAEDAARAYDVAAVQHFGEFARLNLPPRPRSA